MPLDGAVVLPSCITDRLVKVAVDIVKSHLHSHSFSECTNNILFYEFKVHKMMYKVVGLKRLCLH